MRGIDDGTRAAPRLRPILCLGTLADLPAWSVGPRGEPRAVLEAIVAAGYEGVQGGDPVLCAELGLSCSAGGRIDRVDGFRDQATAWRDAGFDCATLHAGTGYESDAEMDRLAEAVVTASAALDFPLMVETHRATMTQDQYRTLRLLERHPQLLINGDFSHWYTGQELRYGGAPIGPRLDRLEPVFRRVAFMHGRIGNGGCMQVTVDREGDAGAVFLQHWRELLTRCFTAFITQNGAGAVLPFGPELLPSGNAYAQLIPDGAGGWREASDRWKQALVLRDLALTWFSEAQAAVMAS